MSAVPQIKPRARILDVSEAEYRADPCEVPSLNQSIAHTIISQSPLHGWAEHPRLGNVPREPTKVQIEGTVVHALLLGKGANAIEIIRYDDYRTKAAQMLRDEVIAQGRTPVLEHQHAELVVAADAIRKSLADQGCVFEGGMAEVSIEWYEDGPEGPVLCRGRLDYLILRDRSATIYDPKKLKSADSTTCMYHADDYGHHIQAAAYTSAVEKLRPDLKDRVEFVWPFHEIEAPYAAVPRPQGAMSKWVGAQQWKRAVGIWQRCTNTGVWPGYPIEPLEVSPRTAWQEEEYAGMHKEMST